MKGGQVREAEVKGEMEDVKGAFFMTAKEAAQGK